MRNWVAKSSTCFEPVQLHLELTDLLIELGFLFFLLFILLGPFVRKNDGQTFQELAFPLHQQIGMDLGVTGDLGKGPISLDDFQGQPGFELGGIAVATCRHNLFLSGRF